MDLIEHNRKAWDRAARTNCQWSTPVTDDIIVRARNRDWDLTVAGPDPVPREWFGQVKDQSVLCLASGGGQQVPVLAAAGANVTSYDFSAEQLELDRAVCARNALAVTIEQGSMLDLSRFDESSFDLIFNPVSNPYVADIHRVWRECARVLKHGGRLIAGSINPLVYLFEENDGSSDAGLTVRYALPFVEIETLSAAEVEQALERKMLFTWSHSLEDIIGGQLRVGLRLAGLFESRRNDPAAPSINRYAPTYIATLSIREPQSRVLIATSRLDDVTVVPRSSA